MNRFSTIALHGALLLSAVLLLHTPQPAQAADRKPIELDILLPEDAVLEINGVAMRSKGEVRSFESRPVQTGRAYAYTLKVVWRGHTLVRRIKVQPEGLVTVDLRKDVQAMAAPKPVGSFTLLVPPKLMVRAGQKEAFPLRVKRFDFPAPIRIRFEGLPGGLEVPEVKLAEGRSDANAILFAAADAAPGTHKIRVVAASGASKDVSSTLVTILQPEKTSDSKPKSKPPARLETKVENKPTSKPEKGDRPVSPAPEPRAEKKPETTVGPRREPRPQTNPEKAVERKPETKPALRPPKKLETAPALRVTLLDDVELHVGRTVYVEVRVQTVDGSPLPEGPKVTVSGVPEVRLRPLPWTSSFKEGRSACTMGISITADSKAPVGEKEVRVRATAAGRTAEQSLKVTIKPALPTPYSPPEK